MKSFLQGVAGFVACGLLVSLLWPNIRAGGSYHPKEVVIKVRVYDTDDHKPVDGAEVTFFRTSRTTDLAEPDPSESEFAETAMTTSVTDQDGYADVVGTFNAWATRNPGFMDRKKWYKLGGGWLKVTAPGRPVAFVALNGHGFGTERDYENDQPLEVIVVHNRAPVP